MDKKFGVQGLQKRKKYKSHISVQLSVQVMARVRSKFWERAIERGAKEECKLQRTEKLLQGQWWSSHFNMTNLLHMQLHMGSLLY